MSGAYRDGYEEGYRDGAKAEREKQKAAEKVRQSPPIIPQPEAERRSQRDVPKRSQS